MFKLNFGLPWQKKESKKDSSPLYLPPRKRQLNKNNLLKRKLLTLLLPPLILIFLGLIFFLAKKQSFSLSNPFEFKQVLLQSPNLTCVSNNQIIKNPALKKYNFFNLNQKEIEQVLKQKYLCLGKVVVSKSFPSKLILNLSPRNPVAQIKIFTLPAVELDLNDATPSSQEAKILTDPIAVSSLSGIFIADAQGTLFDLPAENIQGLPIINYYSEQPLTLGSRLSSGNIEKTLLVLDKFNQLGRMVEQIQILEDALTIKGSPDVKLSLVKDLPRQLVSLQLILQKSTIDSAAVKSVDLRFDKPVVVYSAKK